MRPTPPERDRIRADREHMSAALDQAALATGRTAPNPGVGCVVIDGAGFLAGSGFTDSRPGGPHAEVVALRQAGSAASGGTLYVTLEPCSHWGRTPPCADAIIAAGIRRVVAALQDPDERVSGAGFRRLREAGIEVVIGPGAAAATRLMEGYLKFKRTGLPFALLKMAMTLDGKIATRSGHSRWVTSAGARSYVQELRDRCDAVMVGIGTVIADDPELTVHREQLRRPELGLPRDPLRVVLDSRLRIGPGARVIKSPGRCMILTTEAAPAESVRRLTDAGAEVVVLESKDGRVAPASAMLYLGQRHVHSVMIEGGAELAASAVSAGLVDRLLVFIAPKIVGDRSAPGPLAGGGPLKMSDALATGRLRVRRFDPDIALETDLCGSKHLRARRTDRLQPSRGGSENG
ncbi:MAG: bifunctional diaminohydroxyphosphoribosylaminopyrimidine deaminase/5-amino-6-(5-phosphoribosylamino)uracil reductase RibD [Chloroflexi bacterium]|nr:bifunctional diaminohydroxyphosphoribosylaminopyrimidine deaminase/5-amino-6-(5-phosphoribosylamino)uracil reductase RibD [Chloroflexota bacterium]